MTIKKRSGLGRGLSALLEDSEVENLGTDSAITSPGVAEIKLTLIETNPYQPRTQFDKEALEELAESIRVQGIIQPITVRQLEPNKFQLISGERRFQASKLVGLTTIPAYIRTANDQQMLEMALIENIQRENLNALEIAFSYQRLIAECNLNQEELGDRVGKKRTTVNNYLRLLRLPPQIQAAVRDQALSMGHAKAIVNIDTIEDQLAIFNKAIKEELSVRQIEELVRHYSNAKSSDEKPKAGTEDNPHITSLKSRLSSFFGTKISLKADKNQKGEIKIPFMSTEDLNRILDLINFK